MGWGSGSRLMREVIDKLRQRKATEANRRLVDEILIPIMEDYDWDTQDECMGEDETFDNVLRELHPNWFDCEDLDN